MKKPFVSDKLAKHRKAQSRLRKIFVIVVLVLILSASGYFMYANRFQIQGIEVTGTQAVSSDTVIASANTLIGGKILYVFPKRNIFIYSKPKLKAALAKAYPRLDAIVIQIQNKKLQIAVTERDPAYLWCGESIPQTRQASFETTCYFVDASGYIFSPAPQFSDAVYLRIYTTLPNLDAQNIDAQNNDSQNVVNPIGQYAMTGSVLSRVATFAKQITSATFKPSAFSITPDGDALIFLYRDSDSSPVIRYNPLHDPLTVFAQFKSAISTEPLNRKLATSFATLDYIDVRFPNKIFYKFNDDAGQQQDATATH